MQFRTAAMYAGAMTAVLLAIAAVPAVGVLAVAMAGDECGLSTCDDHGSYFHTFGTAAMLSAMITGVLVAIAFVVDFTKPYRNKEAGE